MAVQQKLTWHSKAIILQLKLFFKEINYLPTTRNRGILNAYCYVKETSLKRLYTVGFQLYNILGKAKLEREQQKDRFPGVWGGSGLDRGFLEQWGYSHGAAMVPMWHRLFVNRQNLTKQRVNCNVCNFFFNWRDLDISQKNADSNAESRDSNCIPNAWNNLTEGIRAGGICWLNFWREEAVRWRAKETARVVFYGWRNRFPWENGDCDPALHTRR